MAFSGTFQRTFFITRKVIDRAFGSCRVPPASITAEYIDIAKDELYLILSEIANYGVMLWCIEKRIVPLYEGVGDVPLTNGVIDVLSANLRQMNPLEGIVTTTTFTHTVDFKQGTKVATVGIKWTAPAAHMTIERSDNNVTWTEAYAPLTPAEGAGEWTWFDLPALLSARYIRVRGIVTGLSTGVLNYSEIVFANNPTEIPVARLNRDEWSTMPNKVSQGRPLQYWFDRQVRIPIMHIWPIPTSAMEHHQLVLQVHRHPMDVGLLYNEIEVPQRWYPAIVAMLAARLAGTVAEVDPALIPALEGRAKEALFTAQQEERDNSPINWAPMIGVYTR